MVRANRWQRRVVTLTASLFVGIAFYGLLGIMIYLYVAAV
jgi:hypothetical protein